ncbi:hypothetical protein DL765_002877 [Monosporascus sp. GIB2]|nr:hypothetical protein DL765_002877 [Monosporascus sp. GIB2]
MDLVKLTDELNCLRLADADANCLPFCPTKEMKRLVDKFDDIPRYLFRRRFGSSLVHVPTLGLHDAEYQSGFHRGGASCISFRNAAGVEGRSAFLSYPIGVAVAADGSDLIGLGYFDHAKTQNARPQGQLPHQWCDIIERKLFHQCNNVAIGGHSRLEHLPLRVLETLRGQSTVYALDPSKRGPFQAALCDSSIGHSGAAGPISSGNHL